VGDRTRGNRGRMFYFSLCHPMAGEDWELGRTGFVSRRGSEGPENWRVAGQ